MRLSACWTSGALIESRQAIVNEDPIRGRKDIAALFFNLEGPDFELAYLKLMGFLQWFREPASMCDDLIPVGPDGERSEKLMKLHFDRVLFRASGHYTEFHRGRFELVVENS